MRLSASSAQRVEICPASAVLPAVENENEAAHVGSAGHEHIEHRVRYGVDVAVEMLDETIARWNVPEHEAAFLRKRLMAFEWSPPPGSLTEIRLALMPDYSVIRVPRDERYHAEALFTGASDVIWAEPRPLEVVGEGDGAQIICPPNSVLYVGDLKFGNDSWVHTIEANLQCALNAFMAARWLKARRVVPATIFPGPGHGEWDAPKRAWGARELEDVEARIKKMLESIEKARLTIADGGMPMLTEGRHCEYCPAHTVCPAKVRMVKNVVSDDAPEIFGMVGGLEPDEARKLVELVAQVEHFAARGKEVLKRYVGVNGPIDMGDGLVYGPKPTTKTKFVPGVAREVLEEELGDEHAAVALDLSGASIKRAVEAKLDGARGVAPMVRRLYAKIGERGGLLEKHSHEFTVHRPDPDAPKIPPGPSLEEQLERSVAAGR